jgi:hypothetical protein
MESLSPQRQAVHWSAAGRAIVICVLAIIMGSLYLTAYSFALGDPVPHRIDAALVGDPAGQAHTVHAMQRVARDSLAFQRYPSVPAALHAIDEQSVYTALDLTSGRPVLYVASASGASVARVLEDISAADPAVRLVDTHPLGTHDPNGLDVFYLMLVTTIISFITVFQVRANAGRLPLRQWTAIIAGLAVAGPLVLSLVVGTLLHRLHLPVLESWGILGLQVVAAASFASLMVVLTGRWAMVPTWLFFIVLGNSSSGGAVAPPLLPAPLAFVSQWLPSGVTVTALRNAVYFHSHQHVRPIAVLATWAAVLFSAMLGASLRLQSPVSD